MTLKGFAWQVKGVDFISSLARLSVTPGGPESPRKPSSKMPHNDHKMVPTGPAGDLQVVPRSPSRALNHTALKHVFDVSMSPKSPHHAGTFFIFLDMFVLLFER